MHFIIVHSPDGRQIVLNVDSIESIIRTRDEKQVNNWKGGGNWTVMIYPTQIRTKSGDIGFCRETVEEVLDLLKRLYDA